MDKWLPPLMAAQREIVNVNKHPHYKETYRNAELLYWTWIPQWIVEDLGNRPNCKALDVGCAYGTLALFCQKVLPNSCTFCTDRWEAHIQKELAESMGFTFAVNDVELEDLPWPENLYDAIIFTEVLEHLNFHPVPTLRKLANALKPDGILYLSTPDAADWTTYTRRYCSVYSLQRPQLGIEHIEGHVYCYTENELRDVFDQSYLQIMRLERAPGVLPDGCHLNVSATRR